MRLLTLSAALLTGVALSACVTADLPPAGQPSSTERPAAAAPFAFSAERLSADTRALSDDSFQGRGIATPAEQMTVDYMVRGFQAAGFQPGGENGGWTQSVALNRFTASNVQARLNVGGQTIPLTQGQQIVASTRLPGSKVDLKNAPLVFVGYGTKASERNWDDFKGTDVRGKVIVVLVNDADFEEPALNTFNGRDMTYYGRWTYKYEEAARQGAAGVLIVHETAPASYGWQTVANSWTGPQFDIVRENAAAERIPLEAWIQRDVAVDLFRRAGQDFEALKVKARSRDFQPVTLQGATLDASMDVATSRITTRNVIARLPGSRFPNETILYTGHWDHIGVGAPNAEGDGVFNGAVDNASGIAGLLELARAFAAGPRPQRSVVMIGFTAEESGLLGSEFYAANPLFPLETTVGGFNIDAMNTYGRVREYALRGQGQSTLDELLGGYVVQQGRALATNVDNSGGVYFRSDHFPLAKRGVPMGYAAGVGEFRDEPVADRQRLRQEYTARRYHQADDEWLPEMDFRGAAEDLEVIFRAGQDLANSRHWPTWKPGSEFGPARERSASARR